MFGSIVLRYTKDKNPADAEPNRRSTRVPVLEADSFLAAPVVRAAVSE